MDRRQLLSAGLWSGLLAGPAAAQGAAAGGDLVYVGTQGAGPGQGVWSTRLDTRAGRLAAPVLAADIERAYWVALHPALPVLYAASATGGDGRADGLVYAYLVDPGAGGLRPLNRVSSGGGGPTQLLVDAARKVVFVANFAGGQVSVLPIHADGALGTTVSVVSDYGSGPGPRQRGPHAHGVALDPAGGFLLAPDLGADRVFVNRYDAATRTLSRNEPPFEQAPAGSGPRHLVFHPSGRFAYLNLELSGVLQACRWDAARGRLEPIQSVTLDPPAFAGQRSVAGVVISADGRFVYVTNRGDDTVVAHAVDPESGRLTEIQRLPSDGKAAWALALQPGGEWMIVANQGSDSLTLFKVDRADGRLTPSGAAVAVPKPVAVAMAPQR